ncbi:MAG: T9SS type A sorting domain-containing protein [Crocinitomicaceae bacterium]|nr:T9SS type A sorting domain-containing protein [Crocinitomicaceae bacterium]
MKNSYKFLAACLLSAGITLPSFGQLQEQRGVSAQPQGIGFAASWNWHVSPDFHHQHDGEHCVTDAITNHWLETEGIAQRYHEEEQQQAILAQNFEGSGERSTYTVPIIFHVVYNPSNPAENVSQADIYQLLDAVNEDFNLLNADAASARTALGFVPANADIEFCLAQRDPSGNQLTEIGIHRVSTTEDYYNPDTETNEMKYDAGGGGTGTPVWNRNNYINVWICDITNGASSGTAGYAYKPTVSSLPPSSIDGIVIDYNLGMDPANRVLTHELGHYFGLSHTWGDTDGTGCTSGNDGLTDTPNTAGPSFNYSLSCSGLQQTCPGTNTQYENYMDYSNCQVMFTAMQSNLMELVLTGSRNSLNSSNACDPVNPVPPVTDFVADITTVVQGGSVNFTDLSTNFPTSWSWTVTPSTGVTYINSTSATSQHPTMQFANTGSYTIALTATNGTGSDTETKTNYITVVASGGGTIVCDTLNNYTDPEEANMTAYSLTGESGYYPGTATLNTGTLNVLEVAEKYTTASPTQVRGVYLPVFQIDDMGAATNITFKVYSHNTGTGLPNALLGTAHTMPLSALNEGYWNEIEFTTPISVSGTFWVSAAFTYSGAFDTVMFATTDFADRPSGAGTGTAAMFISGGFGWYLTSDIFTGEPNTSIIMDALVSNGPAPTAVVSFPVTETCEGMDVTMNGYGSTNTTNYYWDISDGTDDYYYDEANLTTNAFTQGNWTIQLEVSGSCLTDLSSVYNLTVNPPMVVTPTVSDENCIAADGQITLGATGGDGGPYNYSINSGATFQAGTSFTGLVSGDYTVVVTDNANCEVTGTVTVGNDNTFNPTITPDETITIGQNTTLTVTGGVTWTWYEGVNVIGTTSSINVAPTVTTTYYCSVVDASGCEAELEVTVTVIDDSGIDELKPDSFSIYPNPTTGKFSLKFDFNQSHEITIEVQNIVGEKIMVKSFSGVQNQTYEFDMNAVADGVYFVVIRSEDEQISKKLIVRK